MAAIKILLILIEVICGLLLVGVILLQKSKGEGLGMAFGAEMGESIFGARASNVLVKITVWLGVIFLLNTVILATLYSNRSRGSILSGKMPAPIEQPVMPQPVKPAPLPSAPMPALPAPAAPAEATPPVPSAQ